MAIPSTGFGILSSGNTILFCLKNGRSINVSDKRAELVKTLAENGSMSGTQLAERMAITTPHVIKLARSLIQAGIIRKETSTVARNVKLYSLSVPLLDADQIDQIKNQFDEDLKEFVNAIGGDERAKLAFLLEAQQVLNQFPETRRQKMLLSLRRFLAEEK